MKFVYQPEGVEPKKWDFEPGKLMNAEAEAIERHTGMTYAEWGEKVDKGSILALHGLLFVMLKRGEPTLKWDAVQFCLDDLDFELDDDEAALALANLERAEAAGELNEAQQRTLRALRAGQADRGDDPKEAPDHESNDESDSSSSSPST